MSKHTPETWLFLKGPFVGTSTGLDWPSAVIADCRTGYREHSENEANARIIAAAPEMLEVCKKMYDWIGRCADWVGEDPPYAELRAIISKAEGES